MFAVIVFMVVVIVVIVRVLKVVRYVDMRMMGILSKCWVSVRLLLVLLGINLIMLLFGLVLSGFSLLRGLVVVVIVSLSLRR